MAQGRDQLVAAEVADATAAAAGSAAATADAGDAAATAAGSAATGGAAGNAAAAAARSAAAGGAAGNAAAGRPPVGPPVSGAVDGATLDVEVVVVVVVVVLLGALLPPPPHPTANTSMAAPPKTAAAVRASDLIRLPTLYDSSANSLVCYPLTSPANRTDRAGHDDGPSRGGDGPSMGRPWALGGLAVESGDAAGEDGLVDAAGGRAPGPPARRSTKRDLPGPALVSDRAGAETAEADGESELRRLR